MYNNHRPDLKNEFNLHANRYKYEYYTILMTSKNVL